MIKILTSTQEEYTLIKELIDNNREKLGSIFVDLHCPQDSIAPVVWSIEDVRNYFPEGTPDAEMETALRKIEKALESDMTTRGWETIDFLLGPTKKHNKEGIENA